MGRAVFGGGGRGVGGVLPAVLIGGAKIVEGIVGAAGVGAGVGMGMGRIRTAASSSGLDDEDKCELGVGVGLGIGSGVQEGGKCEALEEETWEEKWGQRIEEEACHEMMKMVEELPGSPVTATPPESPSRACSGPGSEESNGMSLRLETGAVAIPHPEKRAKGGEDAHFSTKVSAGVFDGVGGWASVGINAGEYSLELAGKVERYLGLLGPVGALERAVEEAAKIGSSTACVVSVEGMRLRGINLGDSGVLVVREGGVVYKTTEQQHYFNCPYQLGTDSMDTVGMGDTIDYALESGDWIVIGTDGLWDNVFESEILEILESGDEVEETARRLAERALEVGMDANAVSPFSVSAKNAGSFFIGGKLDDITVVVCRARPDDEKLLREGREEEEGQQEGPGGQSVQEDREDDDLSKNVNRLLDDQVSETATFR